MDQLLLFLHFVGFTITIGGALYDRFYIVRNLRLSRGAMIERDLVRIYLSTSPLFSVGVALILVSGIGLTAMHEEGFFKLSALGLKQYLFLGIGLVFPLYIIPIMNKINRLLKTTPDYSDGIPEQCRPLLERLYFALDMVTITNFAILAIAVLQPDLQTLFGIR